MSAPRDSPELVESLRLLHERISRIESLSRQQPAVAGLSPSWNPFSGASKAELERIAALEQFRDQTARGLALHDSLFQDMYERIARIQASAGLPPVPPPPYAPHRPQPYAPAPFMPGPPPPPPPQQPPNAPPWQDPQYAPTAPPLPPARFYRIGGQPRA
jgi:hypothetical protein